MMRRHRLRRRMKRLSLIAAASCALLFLVSMTRTSVTLTNKRQAHLLNGALVLTLADGASGVINGASGVINVGQSRLEIKTEQMSLRPGTLVIGGIGTIVFIPLWILFAATLAAGLILLRLDRPPPSGHCVGCGYNLTGNISGTCPECGDATKKSHVLEPQR